MIDKPERKKWRDHSHMTSVGATLVLLCVILMGVIWLDQVRIATRRTITENIMLDAVALLPKPNLDPASLAMAKIRRRCSKYVEETATYDECIWREINNYKN